MFPGDSEMSSMRARSEYDRSPPKRKIKWPTSVRARPVSQLALIDIVYVDSLSVENSKDPVPDMKAPAPHVADMVIQ